jgi:hypothetical protein
MRATSSQPGSAARKSKSTLVRPDGSVRMSITAMVNPLAHRRRAGRVGQHGLADA